jgi:hypothetical protein
MNCQVVGILGFLAICLLRLLAFGHLLLYRIQFSRLLLAFRPARFGHPLAVRIMGYPLPLAIPMRGFHAPLVGRIKGFLLPLAIRIMGYQVKRFGLFAESLAWVGDIFVSILHWMPECLCLLPQPRKVKESE